MEVGENRNGEGNVDQQRNVEIENRAVSPFSTFLLQNHFSLTVVDFSSRPLSASRSPRMEVSRHDPDQSVLSTQCLSISAVFFERTLKLKL